MGTYIIELSFALLTIASARFQAWWFDVRKRKISHTLWATCYVCVCAIATRYTHVWPFFFVLISQRFVLFAPLLNYWRIPRRPFFYISAKGGSFWDDVLGAWYPFAYIVNIMGYIILQFFI